jgi:hypothetical protein
MMRVRQTVKLQMNKFAQDEIIEKGLSDSFDPWDYRDRLEAQAEGKCYITIVAVPPALMPRDVSGLVINITEEDGPEEYVILYSADADGVLLWRILFHELGHIVLFHVSDPGSFIALRKQSLPGLVALSKPEEGEAEFFSSAMSMYATFGIPSKADGSTTRQSIDGFVSRMSWKEA